MREIKFRCFDKQTKQMSPSFTLFGEFLLSGSVHAWQYECGNHVKDSLESLKDLEVMQFTGLKDKHGKYIYESDVIKGHFGNHWTVVFIDGCFWIYRKGYMTTNSMLSWPVDCYPMFRVDHSIHSEVIGNIYENPELCQ